MGHSRARVREKKECSKRKARIYLFKFAIISSISTALAHGVEIVASFQQLNVFGRYVRSEFVPEAPPARPAPPSSGTDWPPPPPWLLSQTHHAGDSRPQRQQKRRGGRMRLRRAPGSASSGNLPYRSGPVVPAVRACAEARPPACRCRRTKPPPFRSPRRPRSTRPPPAPASRQQPRVPPLSAPPPAGRYALPLHRPPASRRAPPGQPGIAARLRYALPRSSAAAPHPRASATAECARADQGAAYRRRAPPDAPQHFGRRGAGRWTRRTRPHRPAPSRSR